MSALARWLRHSGREVAGYDRVETALTNSLAQEGIQVIYDNSVDALPDRVREDNSAEIIYTPAVPDSHAQLQYFRANGYQLKKRSEALGEIARDHFTIAVAGTHGKTTTSTMIAHILYQANKNCAAFLGGVSANYQTNFVIRGEFSTDTIIVAEADEFDRSFLRLTPNIAVITSMDADHLDIYGSRDEVTAAYQAFANKVVAGGKLLVHNSIADNFKHVRDIVLSDYGLENGVDQSRHVAIRDGEFTFDYEGSGGQMPLKLGIPGYHNVENATAAVSVAYSLGIDAQTIQEALHNFKGVRRRFEYLIKTPDLVFIDDYAHHPAEIEALLKSVRALYPGRIITVVFQPHLYSRTRDFAEGFGRALSLADEALLLDIYPAREEPIEGVSSEMILKEVLHENKKRVTESELFSRIEDESVDVVLTIGAGDIDKLVQPLKTILEKKEKVK